MEKPAFNITAIAADEIAKIKASGNVRGAKAVVGRVINHVHGQDRVEIVRLDDGSEVILKGEATVAKWPDIAYPKISEPVEDGEVKQ